MAKEITLPIDGLSCELQAVVKHFASVQRCPTNFIVASMFAAVGGIAGKRLTIKDGGYSNYGQMYLCLLANPGVGKTPAMSVVMKPVETIDYRNHLAYKEQMRQWRRAEKDKVDMEKPIERKICVDDVTVEKLMTVLSENPNGVLLHADELTFLTNNLDRYSRSNNLPKFLEMWSNGKIRVDRKNDEALMILRPFFSILSGTQPVNVEKIFKGQESTGWFARWLFCLPDAKPAKRECPKTEYFEYWRKVVEAVAGLPQMTLTFADEVRPLLKSFDDARQTACDALAESNTELADYLIKQCYTIRRLAGIIHLISAESDIINGVLSPEITLDEFRYAERVVEFFEKCAAEVLAASGEKRVKKMTDKALLQEFNERFHPTNISELARLIGRSPQYVSKVLLHQNAAADAIEHREKQTNYEGEDVRRYIATCCPVLQELDGLPTDEQVAVMMGAAGGVDNAKQTLRALESHPRIQALQGSIYGIAFSQFTHNEKWQQ